MTSRIGRRKKAKLKAEMDALKNDLKRSRRSADKLQREIDNAPYTYRLAAEICQIAKNINQHCDIIKPSTAKRIRQMSVLKEELKVTWQPLNEIPARPIPISRIDCNAAQVIEDIKITLTENEEFKYMKVFTFKYGEDRACLQLTDQALKHSSREEIVHRLVEHMVNGINSYKGS